jgi:hypothetical protein
MAITEIYESVEKAVLDKIVHGQCFVQNRFSELHSILKMFQDFEMKVITAT